MKFRLKGVSLAYNSISVLSGNAQMINTQPGFHINLIAKFIIFQPVKASILKVPVGMFRRFCSIKGETCLKNF